MAHVLSVSGKTPSIGERVFLAPTAAITGDVTMADDSSAFYGASVRGDRAPITVAEGSNLQDNVTVHVDEDYPCRIGTGVSVGHGAVVHGCTVGDNSLIGMNATVLSGAVIGEECLIAGGALVLGGTEIPPRSLVAGVPAKVRRELTEEEISGLYSNASTYRQIKAEHIEATSAD
ncbi:gamma carbonic anhydrase family protein [Garicola koreensis]|uniref:gamma carbonic anhydrase family protein n=1 Tax=Garicola koreensis TaxID=1262554 RepID=UPI0031EAC900